MTDTRYGIWRTLILASVLVFAADLAYAQADPEEEPVQGRTRQQMGTTVMQPYMGTTVMQPQAPWGGPTPRGQTAGGPGMNQPGGGVAAQPIEIPRTAGGAAPGGPPPAMMQPRMRQLRPVQ